MCVISVQECICRSPSLCFVGKKYVFATTYVVNVEFPDTFWSSTRISSKVPLPYFSMSLQRSCSVLENRAFHIHDTNSQLYFVLNANTAQTTIRMAYNSTLCQHRLSLALPSFQDCRFVYKIVIIFVTPVYL